MKLVELYGRVRFAVQIEGISRREVARRFGIDPRTVAKMLSFSVPPGYRRSRPPARPKLDPFVGIIDQILEGDKGRPGKQRDPSKPIFERLRDEHSYGGGLTIVKDYVPAQRQRQREMFVPLRHDPGHAQADFDEALAVIGGVAPKIHFFAMDLPHSDAGFVQAYPAETTEAFCAGHVAAFAFFGGVPASLLYDNTKLAVGRILGDGTRQRTRVFSELQSHYLFADRFGHPGKGNDKGKVEGLVGLIRRNYLVPVPHAASFAALNEQLLADRRRRLGDRLRGHEATIGARLAQDQACFHDLPVSPCDVCEKRAGRVSSPALARYHCTDYSVPTAYGHCEVLVRGCVERVVISCGAAIIARHGRSYEREDFVFDPLHYLALLERKIGALDQAAPLADWDLPEAFTVLQRQLAGYKLLVIDELGYVPLSQTGAEPLFEVFSQRYERGSTIVTSNLPFDEWPGVFASERLTSALLDRLTHHVHILEMNGDSYQLKQSKRRQRGARSVKTPDTASEG